MKHLLASLSLAAGAAFVFPLALNPQAEDNCNDPSFHFVMSDAGGSVTKDTSNAKDSYCRVVRDNVKLWK